MGISVDFKEVKIPSYVLKTLYIIGFFRDIINLLCPFFGLPSFLDHETSQPDPNQHALFSATSLVDAISPVVHFSDLRTDLEDCCTVCLSDFVPDDKVRQLPNCRHVFHHCCLDRWIVGCRNMTCPICRNRFVVEECYTDMDYGPGSGLIWN